VGLPPTPSSVQTRRSEIGAKDPLVKLLVAEVGIEPDLMAAYETAVCTSSSSPL